jgi:1-acyl-sn-glycerol-3-phosphate acyltransferase
MNCAAIEISDREYRSVDIAAIIRAILRSSAFIFFSLIALAEISVTNVFIAPNCRLAARAAWLHRWCRFACLVLGIRKTVTGAIPNSGLIVCNHLSYLDIVVFSSVCPCVFVAKKDVAFWPLFGWLARAAGTIFADRNRRSASGNVVDLIRSAIDGGALVVLFPEGTSSDGRSVLPFKSALLEPAAQARCELSAAAIDYSLSGGSVADEVCYWRDMTLAPHLLNVFSKREINSKLTIAHAGCHRNCRKELARDLRRQVEELRS